MTPEDARQLIADCLRDIAPEADLSAVDPDEPLADELDLDSMDVLSLYEALASRTSLELPEADYGELGTLAGAVGYLVERTA